MLGCTTWAMKIMSKKRGAIFNHPNAQIYAKPPPSYTNQIIGAPFWLTYFLLPHADWTVPGYGACFWAEARVFSACVFAPAGNALYIDGSSANTRLAQVQGLSLSLIKPLPSACPAFVLYRRKAATWLWHFLPRPFSHMLQRVPSQFCPS